MGNKIFGVVVMLLWGTTMTWLVTAKVLPPFFDGDPPTAKASSEAEPVAWRVELNGRPCGQTVSQAVRGAAGITEIHNRVMLDAIPLPEVAPKWMMGLLSQLGEINLDMRTRTALDAFGNLTTFHSSIRVNETPALVRMTGAVRQGSLRLRLQTGDFVKITEYPWRDGQMLSGQLAPDSRLTDLRVGKRWRSEVYSPFAPPNNPVEMVEAEVTDRVMLAYDGEVMPMHLIEYRSVAAAGVSVEDRLRSEVWVAEDGRVLRQETVFMNARLTFERLPPDASQALADEWLELDRFATSRRPNASPHAEDPTATAEPGAGR